MAYFWLNQHKDSQGYSDVIGKVYNYRSNVPGHRKLSADDWFVYYSPGEYVLFGAGVIDEIETNDFAGGQDGGNLTDYNAHIDTYVAFDPPVQAREIKDKISFLRDRDELRGVPQNSIYEINHDDFTAILRAANETGLLQNQ